ncbi:MAG: bifunctional phosphopantothenoylcysteine decarboxylase/phosphopantothenate--cysteine ligase CoaBC [Lachnospiraceae bacterium]|nr:bifunctional phosphopantothenoylcysteine decarboxylase/phosphopantothenate--cysteine ligase CoaBC [Lachnospiraceae bacterium]
MLEGKTVVLGVTGGIAAYKIPNLASALVKEGAVVHVIMTENATNFITPMTFETLTKNKCIVDTFDRNHSFDVKHVSLAEQADIMMIAPATANVMAKLAGGIADDMLTTTALACEAPIAVVPAMNSRMYKKQVTQDNIEKLRHYGFMVTEPDEGHLACGETGIGKMPEPEELLRIINLAVGRPKRLAGKRVVVTAGPTEEAIDPVRFITNHSSGKMGYAIAEEAAMMGAEVILVSGRTALKKPAGVSLVSISSASDMYEAVMSASKKADIIIKAAAVADYRPKAVADDKLKKSDFGDSPVIELERTDDILGTLGEEKNKGSLKDVYLCGFSMETRDMVENSKKKLEKKHLNLIVANNVKVSGAGFATDTNVVTFINKDGAKEYPLMSKNDVAYKLLSFIADDMGI